MKTKLDEIIKDHMMSLDLDLKEGGSTPMERAIFFRMKDVAIAFADQETESLRQQKQTGDKIIAGLKEMVEGLEKENKKINLEWTGQYGRFVEKIQSLSARVSEISDAARIFLREANILMDYCIDQGWIDGENMTDGQQDFTSASVKLQSLLTSPQGE